MQPSLSPDWLLRCFSCLSKPPSSGERRVHRGIYSKDNQPLRKPGSEVHLKYSDSALASKSAGFLGRRGPGHTDVRDKKARVLRHNSTHQLPMGKSGPIWIIPFNCSVREKRVSWFYWKDRGLGNEFVGNTWRPEFRSPAAYHSHVCNHTSAEWTLKNLELIGQQVKPMRKL